MTALTAAKRREIQLSMKALDDRIRRMQSVAWQMLSHPDATPEQLRELHEQAVRVTQSRNAQRDALMKAGAFPESWQTIYTPPARI